MTEQLAIKPSGLARKRKSRPPTDEQVVIKKEPIDTDKTLPPPPPQSLPLNDKQPTAMEILDRTIVNQRPSTVGTPAPPSSVSAADRATQRATIDEKKLFSDYYSQVTTWIALARIAQNYIATAVNAETAVDLARADEPDAATITAGAAATK